MEWWSILPCEVQGLWRGFTCLGDCRCSGVSMFPIMIMRECNIKPESAASSARSPSGLWTHHERWKHDKTGVDTYASRQA